MTLLYEADEGDLDVKREDRRQSQMCIRNIDTGENGDLSTITSIVLMLTPFILWAAHGAVNLEYFRQDQGAKNFPSFVSSALLPPTLVTLVCTFLLVITAPWLSSWLDISKKWILLIPLLCIINVIPNFTSVIFQAKKKPIHHAAFGACARSPDRVIFPFLTALGTGAKINDDALVIRA